MSKPYPALCADCKHSIPEINTEWALRCTHAKVNAKDSWALAAVKINGTSARDERTRSWPAPCGMRGALWEQKT